MIEYTTSFAPPGGESLGDVAARVVRFVTHTMAAPLRDETILLVCHGASLQVVLTHLLDLIPHSCWGFFFGSTSLTIIKGYPDNPVLSQLNETSFLNLNR